MVVSCALWSFRYQQDKYFTVATKREQLPKSMRPPQGTRFFPMGYVLKNKRECCTVLLTAPSGRPLLVDTTSFDYAPVLRDCLFSLADGPSLTEQEEQWRRFIKDRETNRMQAALLPGGPPARSAAQASAVLQQHQHSSTGARAVAPVVTQPATISSSLNERPEGQTGPAQERADLRGQALIGRRVRKFFGEPWNSEFEGEVVAYLSAAEAGRASSLWCVRFDEDGQVEQYTLGDLNKVMLAAGECGARNPPFSSASLSSPSSTAGGGRSAGSGARQQQKARGTAGRQNKRRAASARGNQATFKRPKANAAESADEEDDEDTAGDGSSLGTSSSSDEGSAEPDTWTGCRNYECRKGRQCRNCKGRAL
jgi:hypothetical protein